MTPQKRLCVGLTGGIGCGKSTVSELFKQRGVRVIDTDEIARQLTGPGGEALAEIARVFGVDFLDSGGAMDRLRMRRLVFSDPQAKARLESVLHPLIRARAADALAHAGDAPYVMLVVPLLFESPAYGEWLDRILVVDCEESLQIQRVMRRSNLSEAEVRLIMVQQTGRAERLHRATDIIHNDGTPDELAQQVAVLHERYFSISD